MTSPWLTYFVLNWKKSFSLIPMSAVPMTIIKINIPKNTCTLRYAARRPSGSLGKRKLTKPKRSWRERQRRYDQFSWAEVNIKTNRTNCLASHNSVKQSISRICGFNEFHLGARHSANWPAVKTPLWNCCLNLNQRITRHFPHIFSKK